MNAFHDLFRRPIHAVVGGPALDDRSDHFPEVVAASRHLHLWLPGEQPPVRGDRLVVGVATWSGYDMNLLDLIEESAPALRVDVFDLDTCRSAADIETRIPGTGHYPNPPYAGLWRNGQLLESTAQHPARELICRVCGIDPAEMTARLGSIYTRH